MRIIALSTLKTFWEKNPEYSDAADQILAWYRHTLKADWATPTDVKQDFRSASILKDGTTAGMQEVERSKKPEPRAVFNIVGNKYRLVVWINYAYRVVYIRFIGTHTQYDKIDVQTI